MVKFYSTHHFLIIMQTTLVHKTYSIKPTYGCNDIKIVKECSELLLIIDVVLNIVIHI